MSPSFPSGLLNTRRSFLKGSALALTSLLTTVGCNNLGGLTQKQSMTLGLAPWLGFMPWQTALEKGIFQANGLDAKITWFPSLTEMVTAFTTGKVDFSVITLTDAIVIASQGAKYKVILPTSYSAGADAIMADPSIRTLRDLANKEAQVELGTTAHLLFLKALEKGNVARKNVKLINTPTDIASKNLLAGKTQVAVSYEPLVGEIIKQKKGDVLFSSRDVPGLIPDLLAAPQTILDRQPELSQKLVKTWFDTLAFRQSNPDAAFAIEAKQSGVSVEEYKRQMQGLLWLSPPQAKAAFQGGYTTESVLIAGQVVEDFLLNEKVIKGKPPTIRELIDNRFLNEYLVSLR
jgi:NitT/TauT family transport system substrate-binding protein